MRYKFFKIVDNNKNIITWIAVDSTKYDFYQWAILHNILIFKEYDFIDCITDNDALVTFRYTFDIIAVPNGRGFVASALRNFRKNFIAGLKS